LEGEFVGEKRVFKTKITELGGQKILQRMTFYNITDQEFTWDWELSTDGGLTWTLSWRIFYERV